MEKQAVHTRISSALRQPALSYPTLKGSSNVKACDRSFRYYVKALYSTYNGASRISFQATEPLLLAALVCLSCDLIYSEALLIVNFNGRSDANPPLCRNLIDN